MHSCEGIQIARPLLRHVDERAVGENHKGRHLPLARQFHAQAFQCRQQRRIAGFRRGHFGPTLATRDRRDDTIRKGSIALRQSVTFFGDIKTSMVISHQETARHKLADQRLPFLFLQP